MKVLFSLTFIFLSFYSIGQDNAIKDSFINNDSIKYDVLSTAPTLVSKNRIRNTRYFIVSNLNPENSKIIKNYPYDKWMAFLKNESSDWAANLILYELYNKDAVSFFTMIKNRHEWVILQKQKDLLFWKTFLKRKLVR